MTADPKPVAFCHPSDPCNRSAFAWPGSEREERHTEPLYDQQAIDALRAEVDCLRSRLEDTTRDALNAESRAQRAEAQAAADARRLDFLAQEPVIEGFVGIEPDVYDFACDSAEESGRDEPNEADLCAGLRRLIDAALARAG